MGGDSIISIEYGGSFLFANRSSHFHGFRHWFISGFYFSDHFVYDHAAYANQDPVISGIRDLAFSGKPSRNPRFGGDRS